MVSFKDLQPCTGALRSVQSEIFVSPEVSCGLQNCGWRMAWPLDVVSHDAQRCK